MKLEVKRKGINNVLGIVKHVIEPTTKNVMIESDETGLWIVATNMEQAIRHRLFGGLSQEYGKMVVEFTDLRNVCKMGKSETLYIEDDTDTESVKIVSDGIEQIVPTLSLDCFPEIPKHNEYPIAISADVLLEFVDKILKVIHHGRFEFFLLKIDFHTTVVATDGKRLVLTKKERLPLDSIEFEARIPYQAALILSKLSCDPLDYIWFGREGRNIFIHSEDVELITHETTTGFPRYKHVIPSAFQTEVLLNTYETHLAVKAMHQLVKNVNDMPISFKITPNTAVIEASNEDGRKICRTVQIKGDVEQPIAVSLNASYVLDFLSTINDEQFTLALNDPRTVVGFWPKGEKESHLYLLMPLG